MATWVKRFEDGGVCEHCAMLFALKLTVPRWKGAKGTKCTGVRCRDKAAAVYVANKPGQLGLKTTEGDG